MKVIRFIAACLLLMMFFDADAQIKRADKHFTYYEFSRAIPLYKKAIAKGGGDSDKATQRIADSYRLMNNNEKALEWYEKCTEIENADTKVYFYYAQALRTAGRYQEARQNFLRYSELKPDDDRGVLYASYCEKALEWEKETSLFKVNNIKSVNSSFSDFCPVFFRDGIIFSSDRKADPIDDNTYLWTGAPYLDLYYAQLTGMMYPYFPTFERPEECPEHFNQTYHDGTASFSGDGNLLFLTRTIRERTKKDNERIMTNILQIFYAERIDGKWSAVKPFKWNEKTYSFGHPSISEDGNTLYFVSDMPGGYGGTDIYFSKKTKQGSWTKPVNLGPEVNTFANEMFPYISGDGILYFSSEGHPGLGSLDIFKTKGSDTLWSEVENLKAPLNSSYDDFGVFVFENGEVGLLSSNRPEGMGLDDIYAFRKIEEEPEPEEDVLILKGYVKEKRSMEPIYQSTVFLLNTETNKVLILKTNEDGMYETEVDANSYYVVKAMKDTYLDDCLTFRTSNTDPEVRDLLLEKYEVNQVFKIENIYYDLDKWFIRPDAEKELDKLVRIMKEQPITIELSSHTDCRASDQYNIDLSQKRAESAVRYLVLNGISPARMTAKGYGETMLVNRCADGVRCTEEEHQQNRRTEFKITSIMEESEGFAQSLDRFKEGDLLSLFFFDRDFFANCYNERKESLLEQNFPDPGKDADDSTPLKKEVQQIVQSSEDSDGEIPEKHDELVKETLKEEIREDVITPEKHDELVKETLKEEIKEDVITPEKTKAEKKLLILGKYTVQIAAGTQLTKKLKAVEGLCQCDGNDGITRFIVGVFDDVNDAVSLRNKMREAGFADAWVVKIDENRSNCTQIN